MTLPALTPAQMQEVDRLMVEEYGIDRLQTLENTGRSLAILAREVLDDDLVDRPVVVLAGRGGNGGGGLAAARHLLNWGAWVQIVCSHAPDAYDGAPARQLYTLQQMGAPMAWAEEGWELPPCDLVVDAVMGCGLQGDPRGKARDLIRLANSSLAPILSLDAPSGVDPGTGACMSPYVQAATTLCLALPKTGVLVPDGRHAWGDLYVADIGAPSSLYAKLDLAVEPVFARDPIIACDVIGDRIVIQHDFE